MKKCFECGSGGYLEKHHVIPRSLGGVKTVLLCAKCHSLAHGNENLRRSNHSYLVINGISKRRLNGKPFGRPSKYSNGNAVNHIAVRVTAAEKALCKELAKRRGITMTELILDLIFNPPAPGQTPGRTVRD